jgi:carbonic anhydrase/acetyltransferase-like protein (isoleucine patch superfamily)
MRARLDSQGEAGRKKILGSGHTTMKSHKKNKLIIFGTKNMAVEIKEMAETFYSKEFAAVELLFFSDEVLKELAGQADRLNLYYIIGFGGTNRKSCIEALSKYKEFKATTIIHPSAVIAKSAKIGQGCLVMANVTISTNAVLKDHCVINYNASVGHDSVLAGNNFVQPGARVSGNCRIGEGTLIGSNSFVYQNVKIGNEVLVDAMTYIHEDVADRMIVSSRYPKPASRDELGKDKLPMWG